MADVIDLSHWNDVSDWAAIKAAGIIAVIHKASEGSDNYDGAYNERRAAAAEAGLLWGSYHFLRPGNMKQQVNWYLACATPQPSDLICCDYEDDSLSLDDLEDFLAGLEAAIGRKAVVYGGSVLKQQVGNRIIPGLASHQLWIAQYSTAAAPEWPQGTWPEYFLWQYTDAGTVPGVTGSVDCDLSPLDDDELRAAWAGAVPAPAPQPDPEVLTVTLTISAPPGVVVNVVSRDSA